MIIEKKLGIAPNYQFIALRRGWWPQANWHRNKLLAVEWAMRFGPKDLVLDLGTGSGNFELEFFGKVGKIVGADYNDEALAFLKSKLQQENINNVALKLVDLRDDAVLGRMGKFDKVVLIDVIEHVALDDGQRLAKKLFKMTNPGGKVCIITPNYRSAWLVLETVLDKVSAVPKLAGEQHLAKYDPETLRLMFEKAGFITDKLTTFNTLAWLFPGKRIAAAMTKKELRAGRLWGNLVLGSFTKPER